MSRNPNYCPHNIIEEDDGEDYCVECGIVLLEPTEEQL